MPLGRLTHEQLDGLADLAETLGDGSLRAAYDQGVVVTGVPSKSKAAAVRALSRLGLEHEADSIARNIIACTGRQFCNIAVSETKGHAFGLMDRLRDRGVKLADIKVNMSGCPSSCAQTYTADIGLKGVRVRRTGGTRDGFDVFLGGGVHGAVELGLPYRKGVDVDQLPTLIEQLVKTYDQEHLNGDTFSRFWRDRLGAGHAVTPATEADYRPDVWACEACGHRHMGEAPPTFCPKCSALRKKFARLGDEGPAPIAEAVATTKAAVASRADGFRDLASWPELQRNGRLAATIDGRELALFVIGSEVRCLDNLCPHEAGPLAQGDVIDGVVACPWHGWTFSTKTGCSTDANASAVKTYPVKVAGDRVLVAFAPEVADASRPAVVEPVEFAMRVLEVIEETHDTKTIRLDNADGAFLLHHAGQHLKIQAPGRDGPTWRSFTISSPPTRPGVVEVTIKLNPSGVVSNAVHALRPGDAVRVKGPFGSFIFDPERHREPLVLAVAGSGVTPRDRDRAHGPRPPARRARHAALRLP